MLQIASHVRSAVIPDTGHLPPEEMLAALGAFLTPYRDGSPRRTISGYMVPPHWFIK
jgi:hypothetical protein